MEKRSQQVAEIERIVHASIESFTVVRRNGSVAPLNIQRIREVVEWACEGLDVNPIELESMLTMKLVDKTTTRLIQKNLIQAALEACSLEEPDWRYVAGRLEAWELWKDIVVDRGYGYDYYVKFIYQQVEKELYDRRILTYSAEELEEASTWIVPERDKDYDHAGMVLFKKRYLLKNELPQEALLTSALLLALPEKPENRLFWAKQIYDAVSLRKLSLATPMLANLRSPNGSATSCFICAMDDTLESIFAELTNAARISKYGGGVGMNISRIRATGSSVSGRPNASGGVVPWAKLLNDTAIAVDQGGSRAGAITVSLDIWHFDIPVFLEMQTENGDQRLKAYDLFPQLVIPDEFMRRVKSKEDWTLVCPYEVKQVFGINLPELWGEKFEIAYQEIEANCDRLSLVKKVNARDLFKEIMRTQVETGLPYLSFKDTINKANPNQHDGYIPGTNLCVAPETKILTSQGHLAIGSLKNQFVEVWNGEQWSKVQIKQTGSDQKLLRVHLSNGEVIDCTYYHHFYLQEGNKQVKIEAQNLKQGDKLIKYQLPVIDHPSSPDFPYAYTHGCFCGDGSVGKGKVPIPEIDLYATKKQLLPYLTVRNKQWSNGTIIKERNEIAVCHEEKYDRIVCKLPFDLPEKFTVPTAQYSLQSRLDWFAGLLDTDGSVVRNESNESFQIVSINKQFLLEIRLMLQTLGIDSKVTQARKATYTFFPEQNASYFCQTAYRLLVSSSDLYLLAELGLKTNRLQWTKRKPQRNASQYIRVTNIEYTDRVSDTFCFTEPKRHMGMFNGVLTGQCVESYSNVKPGELAHTCNLVSLNAANIEDNEWEEICAIAVHLLDNSIDITTTPIVESKAHNDRYRTIGVGVMGLADWLAKKELTYTHLEEIDHLFEDIAYHCTKTSADLAVERGYYPAFEGSEWSKGNLLGAKNPQFFLENSYNTTRWDKLRFQITSTGIRNSHITAIAPNTSSSLIQGCTASILPVFSRFFLDKWAKGTVPIMPPFIKDKFWFYKENKTLNQKVVVMATSVMQKWIDTGISMELLFNLNEGVYYQDRAISAKDIYETLILAWEQKCKAVYYIRTVQKDSFKEISECSSCAN